MTGSQNSALLLLNLLRRVFKYIGIDRYRFLIYVVLYVAVKISDVEAHGGPLLVEQVTAFESNLLHLMV